MEDRPFEDFSEFEQDAQDVTVAGLASMSELANEFLDQQARVKGLEELLKTAKEEFRKLATERMVASMDSAAVSEFKTADGRFKIKVAPFYEGSFPSAEKKPDQYREAVDWLRANGHEGLLKRFLTFVFTKGQDVIADRLKAAVIREIEKIEEETRKWPNIDMEDEVSVHHMTLKSWAREMRESNPPREFPAETLGLFIGRIAKVEKC